MASDQKEKKLFALRIEEDLLQALEEEAKAKGGNKSRIAREIIQNYFHVVKPKRDNEKITMGRNMFKLCLESLSEDQLVEFSELGIQNALREQNVLGNRLNLAELLKTGNIEEFYEEMTSLFENTYGGDGLGWLTSVESRYLPEKECLYLILHHNLNERFSRYLLFHYPEIIRRTSNMKWEVLDYALTETKLEVYLKILPSD